MSALNVSRLNDNLRNLRVLARNKEFGAFKAHLLNLIVELRYTRTSNSAFRRIAASVHDLILFLEDMVKLFRSISHLDSVPGVQSALVQLGELPEFMYDMRRVTEGEKDLHLEILHLNIVKALLSDEQFSIAHEHACSILHRMNISRYSRDISGQPPLNLYGCTDERFSKIALGCWLSILASVSHFERDDDEFESTSFFLIDSLCEIKYWISQSGHVKQHNSMVFRYTLRLLQKIVCGQVVRYIGTMYDHDSRVISLAEFAFNSCAESDNSDQLPGVLRYLAQHLSYEQFVTLLKINHQHLGKFSAENWLDTFEKLRAYGLQQHKRPQMIRIFSFLSDMLDLRLEEKLAVHIICLQLFASIQEYSDRDRDLLSLNVTHHLTQDVYPSHCSAHFWKYVGDLASEVRSFAGMVSPSDVTISHIIRTIETLMENISFLLEAIQEKLPPAVDVTGYENTSGDSSIRVARSAIVSLSIAFVSLWKIRNQTPDVDARQNMLHVIRTCFNCVDKSDLTQVEQYLHYEGRKAAKAVQMQLADAILDVDCDLCFMIASSSPQVVHVNRLSIRLMTYTNIRLQNRTETVEILRNMVTKVLRHEGRAEIRGTYMFELIRCVCLMVEKERQHIYMLQLFRDTAEHLENTDWQNAFKEYYSAWITSLHVEKCAKDQLLMESCAVSMLFNDVEMMTSADKELVDEPVANALFDFLLSLMRYQSLAVSCAEKRGFEMTTHQEILKMMSKRKHTNCQVQQLLRAAKETEAGAYTLHSSCQNLTSTVERERFEHSFVDLVTKVENGLSYLRSKTAQESPRSQMYDDAERHFMKTYAILEAVHSRLCLLDQVTLAEVSSRAVKSITGVCLASTSAAFDTFLIAHPSYVPSFNVFSDCDSETLWEFQRSDLENLIVKDLVETCTLRSQGKLNEAMLVVQNVVEQSSVAIKLAHSTLELWNFAPENVPDAQFVQTGFLRYAGGTVLYQANLWKLIILHVQCIFLKSLLSLSLGFVEVSCREIENSISLCKGLNLRNLATVVQVQYNFFFTNCSLDLSQMTPVSGSVEALELDDSEQAKFLQEAVDIALKYVTLANDGEISSIEKDLTGHGSELCSSLLQKLEEFKSLEISSLADWCYRLIARDLERRSRYVNVVGAKRLICHSQSWLSRAHEQSISDTAFLLLAEIMVSLRELQDIKFNPAKHRPEQYAMVYESINRSAKVILRLQSQSPAFVKRVALIRAALATIDQPLASSTLTLQTQLACSTSFNFRFLASVYSQGTNTRYKVEGESIDRGCQVQTSMGQLKVFYNDMNAGSDSGRLLSDSLCHPLVTISRSCLRECTYRSGECIGMLLTRSSTLEDEMPIAITLPLASTTGESSVGTFVEELRTILAAKPRLTKLEGKLGRDDKLAWWEHRILQEKKMKSLVESVQRDSLGCWWFLLLGEPQEHIVHASREAVTDILSRLIHIAHDCGHEIVHFAAHILRLLLQNCERMSPDEIEAVVRFLLRTSESAVAEKTSENRKDRIQETVLRRAIRDVAAECKQYSEQLVSLSKQSDDFAASNVFERSRGAVFLLFDDELNEFPWESLPALDEQQFYRIPCVACANNYATSSNATSLPSQIQVDLSKTYAIVNPTGDLVNTEMVLLPEIAKMGWQVVSGSPPVDMHKALVSHDMCLYFGHGTAREYLPLSYVPLSWKAVIILMGCSSGVLTSHGDLGLDGVSLSYLLAGSPAILANLWDVTDKDIDRFALGLLRDWYKCSESNLDIPSLASSVVNARANCRLRFLTGASPVIYGAPVFMCTTNSCKEA